MEVILCVDDDRNVLDLIENMLVSKIGSRILKADSIEAAVECLGSSDVDLVVSDFDVGSGSGLDLLRIIRDEWGDTPFILFTGRGQEEVAVEALDMGADFYLQKGGDVTSQFTQLLHFISLALERRRTAHYISTQKDMLAVIQDSIMEFIRSNELYSTFDRMLSDLGRIVGVDRGYIFKNSVDGDGRLLMSQVAEWVDKGVEPQIDNPLLQDLPYDDISPSLRSLIENGDAYINRVDDLEGAEKDILESQGILSMIVIPIFVTNEWWGFIGFDDCHESRDWEDVDLFALQIVAMAMGHLIQSNDATQSGAAAESEYRSLYQMMRMMCDNMPDLIWAKDVNGDYIFINRSLDESIFHTGDAEGAAGKDNAYFSRMDMRKDDPIWIEFRGKADRMDEEVLRNGCPVRYVQVRKENGGENYLDISKAPLLDEASNIIGTVGSGRDITSLRQAMREQERSGERTSLAMAGAQMCVWEYDIPSDRITIDAGESTLLPQMDNGSFGLENMLERIDPDDRAAMRSAFDHLISGGSDMMDLISRSVSDSGDFLWVRSLCKPVTNEDDCDRLVGVHVDITEIQKGKEALQEVNRKLNILSNITRHDILNQVAIIKGYHDLLMVAKGPKERGLMHERLSFAAENIEELITITRDYQELGVLSPQWLSLSDAVREVVRRSKNVVDIHVDTDGTEVFADPLLPRVFYNLIENAIRHGNASRISITFQENPCKIIIEDNGCGIALEEKECIFHKGYGKNTGFGLFLSKEILSITNMSVKEIGEPSVGARFEILVPEQGCRRAS